MSRPYQNRVTPNGQIAATRARGTLMGNRGGRLHDDAGCLGRSRWKSKQWISCVLSFNGRHRQVMGDSYTELFFLDEVTALAAGHRPCFECRRADAVRFAELWGEDSNRSRAGDMDKLLHVQRLGEREVFARSRVAGWHGIFARSDNIYASRRSGSAMEL